ncbi:MAG: flippase-like domain-containing protein [Chitinophagaceae bacterium]|nr:flippase-like domain-containing protein [Chitinophagaceae bacterium]MBK9958107.1 flippase-like domain-containing protein [Chitinophagaceae bacterium]
MNRKTYKYLKYIFFIGLGVFLVWWQLGAMPQKESEEFFGALKETNLWVIPLIALMIILSHLSRAMRWMLLMEPLGYAPKLSNSFAVTILGYFANSFVPRLGEIVKCTFLAKKENLKVDKLLGTVIIERAFDFFCFMLFIAFTVLIQMSLVGDYFSGELQHFTSNRGFPLWLKLFLLVAAGIAVTFFLKWLFKKYPGNKWVQLARQFTHGLLTGILSIRKLKKKWQFLAHTVFIWSMYLLQIYFAFAAFDGTVHLGLKAACAVLTLATFAMIITPGGIGSFPFFVMETLSIYGISMGIGKAFGWLMWGLNTAIILIAGGLCLLYLLYSTNKRNEINTGNSGENIFTG